MISTLDRKTNCNSHRTFVDFTDEADIIEMDIKVDDRLREVIENAKTPNSSRRKRDAIKYNQRRWKNAIVPYSVDDNLGNWFYEVV